MFAAYEHILFLLTFLPFCPVCNCSKNSSFNTFIYLLHFRSMLGVFKRKHYQNDFINKQFLLNRKISKQIFESAKKNSKLPLENAISKVPVEGFSSERQQVQIVPQQIGAICESKNTKFLNNIARNGVTFDKNSLEQKHIVPPKQKQEAIDDSNVIIKDSSNINAEVTQKVINSTLKKSSKKALHHRTVYDF